MAGFERVKNGEFNYLDIKNEGLIIGKSPNGHMPEFYDYMRIKNKLILSKHTNVAARDVNEEICRLF